MGQVTDIKNGNKFTHFNVDHTVRCMKEPKKGDEICLYGKMFKVYSNRHMKAPHVNISYFDKGEIKCLRYRLKDILSEFYEFMFYKHLYKTPINIKNVTEDAEMRIARGI